MPDDGVTGDIEERLSLSKYMGRAGLDWEADLGYI